MVWCIFLTWLLLHVDVSVSHRRGSRYVDVLSECWVAYVAMFPTGSKKAREDFSEGEVDRKLGERGAVRLSTW